MKNRTTKLPCGGCGHPAYWKILKPVHQQSDIKLLNPKLLYYSYRCPDCKRTTEYHPSYVRQVWQEEHPNIKTAIKL